MEQNISIFGHCTKSQYEKQLLHCNQYHKQRSLDEQKYIHICCKCSQWSELLVRRSMSWLSPCDQIEINLIFTHATMIMADLQKNTFLPVIADSLTSMNIHYYHAQCSQSSHDIINVDAFIRNIYQPFVSLSQHIEEKSSWENIVIQNDNSWR